MLSFPAISDRNIDFADPTKFSIRISDVENFRSTTTHPANMAKSKAGTKLETSLMKTEKKSVSRSSNGSPYELDPAQVERAAAALVKSMKEHAQSKEEKADKKNLAADEDESEQNDAPIFLTLNTKQHIKDANRLKPNKM